MLDATLVHPTITPYSTLTGIDEAGRGALAGPLCVAGVILSHDIAGLNDSKKITPKHREILFEQITQSNEYCVVTISHEKIDTKGLSACMKEALCHIVQTLVADRYLFDGNTSFGCPNLHTLVKADQKEKAVMAASIVAKVTRDTIMKEYATIYPKYAFDLHKGYGTKKHYEMIEKYGVLPIHRKSFRLTHKEEQTLF